MTINDLIALVDVAKSEIDAGLPDDAIGTLEELAAGLREHEAQDRTFERQVLSQVADVCATLTGALEVPPVPRRDRVIRDREWWRSLVDARPCECRPAHATRGEAVACMASRLEQSLKGRPPETPAGP